MKVVDPRYRPRSAGNTIAWHISAIEPGATELLDYKLEVEKPATAASVFATSSGTTQSLPDGQGAAKPREASFEEGAYEAAKPATNRRPKRRCG